MICKYKNFLLPVILILLIITNTFCSDNNILSGNDETNSDGLKILFIGSSYIGYNDMPGMFEKFSNEGKKNVCVEKDLMYGANLTIHLRSPETVDNIINTDWDYVVLQSSPHFAAYPDSAARINPDWYGYDLYDTLSKIKTMLTDSENTQIVYMMPWAYEDGLTWIAGQTDTFEDMHLKLYENTIKWADDLGFILAPVGEAWYRVMQNVYEEHYLFLPDCFHPALEGSYLSAAVMYSTIFKESAAGLNYSGGVNEPEAEYLRDAASKIVLENLHLWNLE